VPIYIGATGRRLQEMAGELADGLLMPTLATPNFVKYAKGNVAVGAKLAGRDAAAIDIGATIVAGIDEHDRERGRQDVRELVAVWLANKVQNIRGAADILLTSAGLTREDILPIAEALEHDGRSAAAKKVTDSIMDAVKPIAGTPDDCIRAIEEYYAAGCVNILLDIAGDQRIRQLELFNRLVLPHFR